MAKQHASPDSGDKVTAIDLYWRPGCPFCAQLTAGLKKTNIPINKHNIWDNPADAAVVRSIANGNETVPTVVIGSVGLVNPSVKQIKAAMAEHAPHLPV